MQVFLAEVNAVRAGSERKLPVVVDEHLGVVRAARRDAAGNFLRQFARFGRLAAQLDRLHAKPDHPLDPLGGRQHRVQAKTVRATRERLLRCCRQAHHAREAGQIRGPCVVGEDGFIAVAPGERQHQRVVRRKAAIEKRGQRGNPVFGQMAFQRITLATEMQRRTARSRFDHACALHLPARDLLAVLLGVGDDDQIAAVGVVRRGQANAPRRMGRRPNAQPRADALGGFGQFVSGRPEQLAAAERRSLRRCRVHAALPS